MCGLCGPPPITRSWANAGVGERPGDRLRSQAEFVRLANALIDEPGYKFSAAGGSTSITVQSADGRQRSTSDLAALWREASMLAKRPVRLTTDDGEPVVAVHRGDFATTTEHAQQGGQQ